MRVEKGQKVFIIKGGYHDVRRAMEKRGWFQNPDVESPCFDFKWCLRIKDINQDTLDNHQIVNHFSKNAIFTTKAGLTQSLKNLVWNAVDVHDFYPRCYDLRQPDEMEDFIQDYKQVRACNLLKIYAREIRSSFK